MPDSAAMLIAVAPNGARRNKADHPALPISPAELALTARKCLDAGAAMMHLHVRDPLGKHSIASEYYRPAIDAIRSATGTDMLIQVTSEAAGVYNRHQQMAAILELMPDSVSIALRELVPDADAEEQAHGFFKRLDEAGALIQYILYSPEDVMHYQRLCASGVIPGQRHFLLFVLGRYSQTLAQVEELDQFVSSHNGQANWMCCAFGKHEQAIMLRAAQLGGHARVGFENNLQLPDGSLADDNCALVKQVAENALKAGRTLASAQQGQQLYLHGT